MQEANDMTAPCAVVGRTWHISAGIKTNCTFLYFTTIWFVKIIPGFWETRSLYYYYCYYCCCPNLSAFISYVCHSCLLIFISLKLQWPGAYEQEHASPLYFCHGVFIDRFIFKLNLLWMRLPWECHNQSQDTNWRHCVTGPELPFFHKRKRVLKIDQSVKMPWHRISMGVASSCLSAPAVAKRKGFI